MSGEESIEIIGRDGASLTLCRVARPGRPRLLISHGNGFAIDGYRKFWELLTADFELCLFDLRSHGRNARTSMAQHSIAAMAADHACVRAQVESAFGKRTTLGLFHSVSSIAAIMAARDHGVAWDGLILFDPPLIAPPGNPLRDMNQKLDETLAKFALARPHRFASVAELAEQIRQRAGRNWVEGAAHDMAAATTRALPDGGCELSCPGEYEAKIYAENAAFDSFDCMAALAQPTLLICADPDAPRALAPAFSGPQAAARFGFDHVSVPGTGHLLQIEKPEVVAEHVRTFAARFAA